MSVNLAVQHDCNHKKGCKKRLSQKKRKLISKMHKIYSIHKCVKSRKTKPFPIFSYEKIISQIKYLYLLFRT